MIIKYIIILCICINYISKNFHLCVRWVITNITIRFCIIYMRIYTAQPYFWNWVDRNGILRTSTHFNHVDLNCCWKSPPRPWLLYSRNDVLLFNHHQWGRFYSTHAWFSFHSFSQTPLLHTYYIYIYIIYYTQSR